MSDQPEPTQNISGTVKWFDPVKGFGFVVADAGGPDILLHMNVLQNYGQSSIAEGVRLDVSVQQSARGAQVVEVIHVHPPTHEHSAALSDLDEFYGTDVSEGRLEPGRVKWFDRHKGFGFANVFGKSEDVFLHAEVLRRSGLADLQTGEALALRVIDGKRGKMAAEILAWEAATVRE